MRKGPKRNSESTVQKDQKEIQNRPMETTLLGEVLVSRKIAPIPPYNCWLDGCETWFKGLLSLINMKF